MDRGVGGGDDRDGGLAAQLAPRGAHWWVGCRLSACGWGDSGRGSGGGAGAGIVADQHRLPR